MSFFTRNLMWLKQVPFVIVFVLLCVPPVIVLLILGTVTGVIGMLLILITDWVNKQNREHNDVPSFILKVNRVIEIVTNVLYLPLIVLDHIFVSKKKNNISSVCITIRETITA